jgi:hypothetical protein
MSTSSSTDARTARSRWKSGAEVRQIMVAQYLSAVCGVLGVFVLLLSETAYSAMPSTTAPVTELQHQRPNCDVMWNRIVAHGHDCGWHDHEDFVVLACKSDKLVWYFTKPNNPAHPAMLKKTWGDPKVIPIVCEPDPPSDEFDKIRAWGDRMRRAFGTKNNGPPKSN